jgi:PST family polysaccharide transporter
VNEQPDLVVVGHLGGSAVLGNYDTARRWAWYPFDEPFLALTEVAIAALGRVRDDAVRFRHVVSRFVLAMLTVSLPLAMYVTLEAPQVVRVVLGAQWEQAAPLLRVIGLGVLAGIVTRTATWIPLARGDTPRLLRWSLGVQVPAGIVAALVGGRWGARGVAMAMASVAVVLMLPALRYLVQGSAVGLQTILRAAARPGASCLLAAAALVGAGPLLPVSAGLPRLLSGAIAYFVTYVVCWIGLPGGMGTFRELAAMLRAPRDGGRAPSAVGE